MRSANFERLIAAANESETHKAIELLENIEPLTAAQTYFELQKSLYWKSKNLPAVIAISQAGIKHCLSAARTASGAAQPQLLSAAKRLAYNVAAYTWPGWDKDGIIISKNEQVIGLEAARLNVDLAQRLKRPAESMANALWILAAQQLAAGLLTEAAETLTHAQRLASQTTNESLQKMLDAYQCVTRLLRNSDDLEAKRKLDETSEMLRSKSTYESIEYARQLSIVVNAMRRFRAE